MHQSKDERQPADSANGHHGKRHNANSHNAKRHNANIHNVKRNNAKRHNAKGITQNSHNAEAYRKSPLEEWRPAVYSVNNFSSKKKRQSIAQGKEHIIAMQHFFPV